MGGIEVAAIEILVDLWSRSVPPLVLKILYRPRKTNERHCVLLIVGGLQITVFLIVLL